MTFGYPTAKPTYACRVPARNLLGTIEPAERQGATDPKAEIQRALKEPIPIGSKRLSEIATSESKVVIVVDDATRKTPTEIMLSPVLAELNLAGVKDENITIIFGCATHHPVKPEEATVMLGAETIKHIKTLNHDSKAHDLVNIGTTKTCNNRIYVNRVFAEADVKILLGTVDFHYYAGYGGGRKSVLPAICGEETIKQNHAMLLHAEAPEQVSSKTTLYTAT